MARNAEEITRYGFQATDELLLDANVWFFLYGPYPPGSQKAAVYSRALAKILVAKSRIYVDVLVISEFVNRYARLKHQLLQGRSGVSREFKTFRQSSTFKAIARDIAADVRRILANSTRAESGFAALDIDSLVTEYGRGDSDFNDLVLTELCKSRGFTLVTDDGDFKGKDIAILTANKRLLA